MEYGGQPGLEARTWSSGTSEEDALKDVTPHVLEQYMKSLKDDFPNAIHVYSFLHTLVKWKKMRPDLDILVVAPEGDPNNGILLCYMTYNSFIGTVFANDEKSVGALGKALQLTKRIPLHKEVTLFTCMTERSFEVLDGVVGRPEWCINHDTVYWLPWYVAREVEPQIPEGVEVRKLTAENAKQMNAVWPHRYDGSEELIRDMIDVNFGMGVFRGDKLLSWVLVWFYGGIGVLQTEEAEKRKGYARAVVETLTKQLGEQQFDVHLNVVGGNDNANAFFKALGFRYAFPSVWATRGLYRNRALKHKPKKHAS